MWAIAAAISCFLTSGCPPWLVLSSQQSLLEPWPVPGALQKWFRNIPVSVQCCGSSLSFSLSRWICPEVCKTKCNPAAWLNFPPSGERKLAKLSINKKNQRERGQECQHYFSTLMEHLIIIAVKHTVCWLYQFCQEMCKHAILQLSTAVSHAATISQFSVQGCASQTSCLVHVPCWLSLCSQCPKWGQREARSCRAWKRSFNISHRKQAQPKQAPSYVML